MSIDLDIACDKRSAIEDALPSGNVIVDRSVADRYAEIAGIAFDRGVEAAFRAIARDWSASVERARAA